MDKRRLVVILMALVCYWVLNTLQIECNDNSENRRRIIVGGDNYLLTFDQFSSNDFELIRKTKLLFILYCKLNKTTQIKKN